MRRGRLGAMMISCDVKLRSSQLPIQASLLMLPIRKLLAHEIVVTTSSIDGT